MKSKFKDNLKLFRKLVLVIIVSSIIGYLFLALAYSIPTDRMRYSVSCSSDFFKREGSQFQVTSNVNGQLDGSTDALMLLIASQPNDDNAFRDALESNYYKISEDAIPCQTLIELYEEDYKVNDNIPTITYSRYWHGYLVLLKPLLLIANYGDIRSIVCAIQLGLVFVLFNFEKKTKILYAFLITWLFLNPLVTLMSLQNNTIFIITLCAMIGIAYYSDRWEFVSSKWLFYYLR